MGTTANSVLDERLRKAVGDWLEFDTTTDITTSAAVISTTLRIYDGGNDGYFDDWWLYITEGENIAVERKTGSTTYATSSGTLTVWGENLAAESGAVTCRLGRYSYAAYQRAINDAIRELSPVLFRYLEDRTLVTGNILPDNSFELWISSSNPSLYSASASATLTRTTTAGLIRGPVGTTSMFVEAGDTNQYAYINSDTFPRLLDLKGETITLATHTYPSTANDAFMDVVYTEAGSSTTVSTTTTCGASRFTLLKREGISIPDGIEKIEFRWRVASNGEDAYFDSSRVTGKDLREYLLLSDFADGGIAQVHIQSSSDSDDPCDDLHPRGWDRVFNYSTYSDGTYLWLRLPYYYGRNRQIRIIGTAPLSTVSTFAGATEIDGGQVDLLVAYAAYCLFRNEEGAPSSEDIGRYTANQRKWLNEYERLKRTLGMVKPHGTLHIPAI